MKVAVIGAGVIGCTTALAIKEAYPTASVTIFADVFTPDTTGDGSAGLWGPYILADTPEDDILRWAGVTHRWFEALWKSELASDTGVSLVPVTRVTDVPEGFPKPAWTSIVYGPREMRPEDLRRLNVEHKAQYTGGWQFLTYTCEPVKLLPWLSAKFLALGGVIERRKIEDLDELGSEGYDLIVNCAGLGSRELVKDSAVKPVRGQVMRVDATWAFQSILVDNDDGWYIIPNTESVILGGTHQVDDYDREVRDDDSKFIRAGCCRMVPGFQHAKIIKEWVGLRPGRSQVRLEPEYRFDKNKRNYTVIHNYGHGGSGVTLCWGCALDVVEMIRKLKNRTGSKL